MTCVLGVGCRHVVLEGQTGLVGAFRLDAAEARDSHTHHVEIHGEDDAEEANEVE
jgi:hypothetical protein